MKSSKKQQYQKHTKTLERDINRNFDENEIPQENGNASMISQQIIRSSTFPQTDVLSSSLEAEHRLVIIFTFFSAIISV